MNPDLHDAHIRRATVADAEALAGPADQKLQAILP